MSLALPLAALAQTPPVPPVPAAPQTAPQKPAPAAPPNLYEPAWDATLDLTTPLALVTTTHTAIVAGGSKVVAFNVDDGKERWSVKVPEITALAADDERAIVGTEHSLIALDVATGASRWTLADLGGAMRIVDRSGWLVTARGADLAALRVADGTTVWRHVLGPTIVGSPQIDGDALFVLLSDGRLSRLALTTGEVQWSIDLDANADEILAANDRLYVSLGDGRLMVYREQDGHFAWRYQFNAQAVGAVSDLHRVYLSLRDNSVQAIDRDLGNQQWKAPLPERLAAAPLLTANVVLMPLAGGEIDIAQVKDGKGVGKIAAPTPDAGSPGSSPRVLSLVVTPNDTILRIVNNGETLTLAAFRRPPPAKK